MAEHVTDWEALAETLRRLSAGRKDALARLADGAAERRARGGPLGLLVGLWQDALYGLRLLGRNRGFAAADILTMAIGIGANTAVFSIIDATLFLRLPYPQAGRIVSAGYHSELTFRPWEKENTTFTALSADIEDEMTLTREGPAERLEVARVTSGFFPTLGVQPVLGRAFSPSMSEWTSCSSVRSLSQHQVDAVVLPASGDNGPSLRLWHEYTPAGELCDQAFPPERAINAQTHPATPFRSRHARITKACHVDLSRSP